MIRQRLNPVGDLQTDVKPEAFHANAIVALFDSSSLCGMIDLSSAPRDFEGSPGSANPRINYIL